MNFERSGDSRGQKAVRHLPASKEREGKPVACGLMKAEKGLTFIFSDGIARGKTGKRTWPSRSKNELEGPLKISAKKEK